MRHLQFLFSQNFPFMSAVGTELEKVDLLSYFSVTAKIFVPCKHINLFKYR